MSEANVVQSNEIVKRKGSFFNIENELGKVYGRLTVIGEAEPHIFPNGKKSTKVTCECECGAIKTYRICLLKQKICKSCGCFNIDSLKGRAIHGHFVNRKMTPEYRTWSNIKTRTANPNCKEFENYGGRGVLMCKDWLNSFQTFFEDMGKRPSPQHSIERKDVDGGYAKDNCYWANIWQQAANKRNSNKTVGVRFVKKTGKWLAELEVNKKKVLSKRFDAYEEAVKARKESEIKYNIMY